MKLNLVKKLSLFLAALSLMSCVNDFREVSEPPKHTKLTHFMYMPYTGNLTSFLNQNLNDIEKGLADMQGSENRILCFFADSKNTASLFEFSYVDGIVERKTIKTYTQGTFKSPTEIATLFSEMMEIAPSDHYNLTISGHGMGWLPVLENSRSTGGEYYWVNPENPLTRYFGGLKPENQVDISDLKEGIEQSGIDLGFIQFDNCYMSNIEVAYELKEVADYIIACPTEVMAYGFPYHTALKYMLEDVNYEEIVNSFMNFYENYSYPYGTIAVLDTKEVDYLAGLMTVVNEKYSPSAIDVSTVQTMDGYNPYIFMDFGDYVTKLCGEDTEGLASLVELQLEKLVIYKGNTSHYYAAGKGALPIRTYSGITISDASKSTSYGTTEKTNTAWYKATHK